MRMSDWSSDVCSSDLLVGRQIGPSLHLAHIIQQGPQFALMRMDIFGQTPAGIGEQHVMDESDAADRKSVVKGKRVSVRVDLGVRRCIKKRISKQIHELNRYIVT